MFPKNFVPGKRPTTASTDGHKRVCGMIFFALRKEADTEWIFIDGSYVRVHQHGSGARRGEHRAIGTSRGGPTTKIHMATDAHGNPLCIEITGGQVHDSQVANILIDQVQGKNLIADKGYDSEEIREKSRSKNMSPIIPRKSNSKLPNPEFDSHIYRNRHLV
jgi:transposase